MKITAAEYAAMVKRASPNSHTLADTWNAFWIGGLICTAGQAVRNIWMAVGMEDQQAGTATAVTMVFLGALLTGLGLYDRMAKKGGAGTLVPITGFANAVVSPAMEFRSEGLVGGMSAKMFTIAGPVLVYGLSASVIYGIIYYVLR